MINHVIYQSMKEVIFQNIFGQSWRQLPEVFQKHYANRAYSNDIIKADGWLEIEISPILAIFAPLLSIFGTLLPRPGRVDCQVDFTSNPKDKHFRFIRKVVYENQQSANFNSRLEHLKSNEVIEFTKSGIGWHCTFDFDGAQVNLRHKSYCMRIFGIIVPIPLELFFGVGIAHETPIDEDNFAMYMEMRHPIFGKIYGYSGEFQIVSMVQND